MNPFNRRNYVGAFALLILSLCIAGTAQAQAATTRVTACDQATPNNALCITGTAPSTMIDGTPTVLPLTYRIEQRTGSTGSYATVATGLTELKYYAQNLAPGTYFFRAYANCATCTSESVASNAVSKSATANPVVPGAPVLIIAATISANGPPTFRIVYTVTPRPGEVVFVAPGSLRPYVAAR